MDKVATAAPWITSVKKALNHGGTQRPKRDRREANRKNVQLATVDASGRPSVRTVVFRGFYQDSPILTFVISTLMRSTHAHPSVI